MSCARLKMALVLQVNYSEWCAEHHKSLLSTCKSCLAISQRYLQHCNSRTCLSSLISHRGGTRAVARRMALACLSRTARSTVRDAVEGGGIRAHVPNWYALSYHATPTAPAPMDFSLRGCAANTLISGEKCIIVGWISSLPVRNSLRSVRAEKSNVGILRAR